MRLVTVLGAALMLALPARAEDAPELPKPDLATNTFLLVIGKSSNPDPADEEAEDVFASLGPGKIYVRLWYDGPCSKAIQEKHNGYRPHFWNSPLDDQNRAYKSADRRMRQWSSDGRIVTEEERRKGGNPADADLTPSGYAKEAYDGMLEMARREAKSYLAKRKAGDRVFLFCGPNEFEYVFFDKTFTGDYSPFAVAEFRDWLTHRGEFAKGGRFEGQGRKGGEAFADDPSPAQAKGGNAPFNAVFKTRFATWALLYWDLDAFPDPLDRDAKGMPGANERGFTAGGFDAPREMKDALWKLWQNRDPQDPGYRQWRIHRSLEEMFRIAREEGIPREEIWSRERTMHSHKVDYWKDNPSPILAAWVAITRDSNAGFNRYGFRASLEKVTLENAAAEARAAGAQFGTLEFHPSMDPEPKLKEEDYAADLEAWYAAGARVLGCREWKGQNTGGTHGVKGGALRIKGTPFEPALKKFLASRPDRPFGAPANQAWAPPRPRGAALAGTAFTWKDGLWEGEPFRYADWQDFGTFEVATCEELTPEGAPKNAISLGTPREAKLEVAAGRAKKFLVVRGVSRLKVKGRWSEAVEVK